MTLLTDREVATQLGVGFQLVQRKCRAKQWPHLRIGRQYMFKPEHIDQITALREHKPVVVPLETWGRKTRHTA